MSTPRFPSDDVTNDVLRSPTPPVSPPADPLAAQVAPPASTIDSAPDTASGASAQDAAAETAGQATDAAKHVAGTAKDEAGEVLSEAKGRTRELYHQTRDELRDQAGEQQKRVAGGLRTLGDQLGSMAEGADSGVASDLVRQASQRAGSAAEWLDRRDPGSLLGEVRHYAARKPGTFIAIAALGGILAGRLTTSLVANAKSDAEQPDDPTPSGSGGAL